MSITVLGGDIAQPMRISGNSPTTRDLPTSDPGMPVGAPDPRLVSRVERRRRPSGVKRRHGVYVPLKLRIALTFVAGALWFCFSLWLSRGWISTLGQDISTPLAILVIAGIALIPGYLNVQLISSILLDSPRPLRFDGDFPQITLLVAAYNEEDSIAETLDYALRADYPGHFELVVADDGSTDRTREIVAEYAARYPCVRLLAAEHGGKANTLNAALQSVSTPLTATIDADTLGARDDRGSARSRPGHAEPAQVLFARGGRQLPVPVRRPDVHTRVHPRLLARGGPRAPRLVDHRRLHRWTIG